MTESLEKASQTDEEPQTSKEEDAKKVLNVLARYFPETSQVYKSVKEQLDRHEPRHALVEQKAITSRKSNCAKAFNDPNKKPKPDHKYVIEQRAEI